MKKKVRFLVAIAGAGDPSPADLQAKYDRHEKVLREQSLAKQKMGRPGLSDDEIERSVERLRKEDAKIPRLSGFTHEFAFKPDQVALVPADVAAKWVEAGICILEEENRKAA